MKLVNTSARKFFFLSVILMQMHGGVSPKAFESLHRSPTSMVNSGVSLNQQIASSSLNTSATSNGLFMISKSGRYFLSTDIFAAPCTSHIPIIYINASDVVLDLGGKSITLSSTNNTPCASAISIAAGKKNIAIINGTINGTNNGTSEESRMLYGIDAASNTNIMLDNVHTVSCKKLGIRLSACKEISINNVRSHGNSSHEQLSVDDPSFSGGLGLFDCSDGIITNSSFSGSFGTGLMGACGIFAGDGDLATGTHNFKLVNVNVSHNRATNGDGIDGNPTAGLILSGCTGFICENMTAHNNALLNAASESPYVAGIALNDASGNKFESCTSHNNTGATSDILVSLVVAGFYLTGASSGNSFLDCTANKNIATGPEGGSLASVAGFYVGSSKYNSFQECVAQNNHGINAHARGLYASGCVGTLVKKCKINGGVSDALSATGIFLSGETAGLIQECETNNNISTLSSAYGIRLASCTNCSVEYNKMFANNGVSKYGFYDGSDDCTTFLRGNVSFGHGKVFASGQASLTDSGAMNYYLDYAETSDAMNIQMLIKEGDIANMNAFEAGSPTWFNFSILQGAISG